MAWVSGSVSLGKQIVPLSLRRPPPRAELLDHSGPLFLLAAFGSCGVRLLRRSAPAALSSRGVRLLQRSAPAEIGSCGVRPLRRSAPAACGSCGVEVGSALWSSGVGRKIYWRGQGGLSRLLQRRVELGWFVRTNITVGAHQSGLCVCVALRGVVDIRFTFAPRNVPLTN